MQMQVYIKAEALAGEYWVLSGDITPVMSN